MAAHASILAWSKWAHSLQYFASGFFVSVVWSCMTGFCQFAPPCSMHTTVYSFLLLPTWIFVENV